MIAGHSFGACLPTFGSCAAQGQVCDEQGCTWECEGHSECAQRGFPESYECSMETTYDPLGNPWRNPFACSPTS